MTTRFAALLVGALMAPLVYAADPVLISDTPSYPFEAYSSPTPVGEGLVDTDALFYIDEKTGALGNSYYVFFDPLMTKNISAVIQFDTVIVGVLSTKDALDASNAEYGAAGINYGTSALIGLEDRTDSYSFAGAMLTIDWHASDPGDHIRVFTLVSPVPEPETYALLMAGLFAIGYVSRRRARR